MKETNEIISDIHNVETRIEHVGSVLNNEVNEHETLKDIGLHKLANDCAWCCGILKTAINLIETMRIQQREEDVKDRP